MEKLYEGEDMFTGFKVDTFELFKKIMINNNKEYFNEHKNEYELFIKLPLTELYYDLLNTITDIDKQLEYKLSRCISTPYTDARFMREKPIKEYVYIRFKLRRDRKNDIPGFFFDASIDSVRFGLKIYNITALGMENIRQKLLKDIPYYNRYIKKLEKNEITIKHCEKYKRDHYPTIKDPLKNWLNSKDINICYLSDKNILLKSELRNEISHTFYQLENIYDLIKNCLDE
jgi:uncharacterized protein (DUF2461 family)